MSGNATVDLANKAPPPAQSDVLAFNVISRDQP